MRKLDFFQKVNEDIDTSSVVGGLSSLVAMIIGVILFSTEYQKYREPQIQANKEVANYGPNFIKLNFDIVFLKSPCHFLSLDLEDTSGMHEMNIRQNVKLFRLDREGKVI